MIGSIGAKIKNFIRKNFFRCNHEKVNQQNRLKFCPDCGQRIHLNWYIAICSDCNYARETVLIFGKPFSAHKNCPICASKKYKIDKTSEIKHANYDKHVIIKEILPVKSKKSEFIDIYKQTETKYLKLVKNNVAYNGLFKADIELIKK